MLDVQHIRMSVKSATPPILALLVVLTSAGTYAQSASDPVQRDMDFVEKTADATELFNAQRYAEALPVFQSLAQSYADLDTDGFVLMGYGDCLAALGRVAEARSVYEAALTADPRRQEAVHSRLEELQLKGPIDAEVLELLRTAARDTTNRRFTSMWRLARALQKNAADLLAEAAQSFRDAAQAPGEKPCSSHQLNNQAIYLDELVDDLRFLIDEIEGHLTIPRNIDSPTGKSEPALRELRTEQLLELPDGRHARIEIEQRGGSKLIARVDGKEVQLTPAEQQLLRRHQDRTNAIILKAEHRPGPAAQAGTK